MLIAQITDLHLGFEPGGANEPNHRRLVSALDAIAAHQSRPDLLLITGDLTERGDTAAYVTLKDVIAQVGLPAFFCLGNHDVRSAFATVFPRVPTSDGFVQYAIEDWPVRLLVLDTLEEGRHGGAFCDTRATWLQARLAEDSRPTLIVLHHPPIDTGIAWLTSRPDEPWVRRLTEVVSRHSHVLGAVSGHIHRPIVAQWGRAPLVVCPSTAPQAALDLEPIDLDRPDDRPLMVEEAPGFALHRVSAEGIITWFGVGGGAPVLARYDAKTQAMLRSFASESGEISTTP